MQGEETEDMMEGVRHKLDVIELKYVRVMGGGTKLDRVRNQEVKR